MKVHRLAVLMGGPSREREVSLRSGEAVAGALEARGHGVARVVVDGPDVPALARLAPELDAVFIALHGRFGEDGEAQRLCERLGLPYTGSGPEASALALDKVAAKRRFEEAGVPTPAWRTVETSLDPARAAAEVAAAPGLPCVVKPIAEGSSIGVTIVESPAGIGAALAAVTALEGEGGLALVERFVPGRELTVGVVGETALRPIEMRPRRAFYDYRAKYERAAGTEYVLEPDLEPAVDARLRDLGLRAHLALGCEGLSRVDIRLDPRAGPFVLEVNTIPGFTETSLLPKAAAAAGISFGDLCERLVALAVERAARARRAAA